MDSSDIILAGMLLKNSRTPYRSLAEKLDLSVNAVHKRVQSLIDQGIIRSYIARPSLAATGGITIIIHGSSEKNPETLVNELKNDKIYWLSAASGGYLYIGAYLANLGELSQVLEYVQNIAGLKTLNTAMLREIPISRELLDDLDWQIIGSLSNNSRKPLEDVANELKTSVRTIRRRLNNMIKNNTIELTIDWYPDAANDIVSMTHIKIHPGSKLEPLTLYKEYGVNMIIVNQPINSANELLCITWSPTMMEMKTLIEKIRADPKIESATPNILYMGWLFKTWRDKFVNNYTKSM